MPKPANLPPIKLEDTAVTRELELMRERQLTLYQMILDLTEEIDSIREQLNLLCQLWRNRS